jgi:hypothetical protein
MDNSLASVASFWPFSENLYGPENLTSTAETFHWANYWYGKKIDNGLE